MGERTSSDAQIAAIAHGHRWLRFFTKRWRLHKTVEDDRPWFEASFVFQARDMAQAEFLFLQMEDGLGCSNDPEHVCEHFRVGGLHQLDEETT